MICLERPNLLPAFTGCLSLLNRYAVIFVFTRGVFMGSVWSECATHEKLASHSFEYTIRGKFASHSLSLSSHAVSFVSIASKKHGDSVFLAL
jgi:hypothetical protein